MNMTGGIGMLMNMNRGHVSLFFTHSFSPTREKIEENILEGEIYSSILVRYYHLARYANISTENVSFKLIQNLCKLAML